MDKPLVTGCLLHDILYSVGWGANKNITNIRRCREVTWLQKCSFRRILNKYGKFKQRLEWITVNCEVDWTVTSPLHNRTWRLLHSKEIKRGSIHSLDWQKRGTGSKDLNLIKRLLDSSRVMEIYTLIVRLFFAAVETRRKTRNQ